MHQILEEKTSPKIILGGMHGKRATLWKEIKQTKIYIVLLTKTAQSSKNNLIISLRT